MGDNLDSDEITYTGPRLSIRVSVRPIH